MRLFFLSFFFFFFKKKKHFFSTLIPVATQDDKVSRVSVHARPTPGQRRGEEGGGGQGEGAGASSPVESSPAASPAKNSPGLSFPPVSLFSFFRLPKDETSTLT